MSASYVAAERLPAGTGVRVNAKGEVEPAGRWESVTGWMRRSEAGLEIRLAARSVAGDRIGAKVLLDFPHCLDDDDVRRALLDATRLLGQRDPQ